MPKLRGIAVSINAHFDQAAHPEYKETRSRRGGPMNNPPIDHPLAVDDMSSNVVSVYIPSVSAERFFVKYSIDPPFPHGVYFYFKMYMNGRHMNSWGINPRMKSRGQVTKCLFQGEELNYNEQGMPFLRAGIEARSSMFAQQRKKHNPAQEGGDIEIVVFRSCGRRKKHAAPQAFKDQEEFGILFTSSGLVASPAEDAKFYDWILIDSKDKPYATFKFYYRTWEDLSFFQIIPTSNPRSLLPVTQSYGSLAEYLAKAYKAAKEYDSEEDEDNPNLPLPIATGEGAIDDTRRKLPGILKYSRLNPAQKRTFATPPKASGGGSRPDGSDVQATPSKTSRGESELNDSSPTLRSVESHRRLPILSFFNKVTDNELARRNINARPLPQPPVRPCHVGSVPSAVSSSARPASSHSHQSSVTSTTSSMAGITPSLRDWVRDGENSTSPSPPAEILKATLVVGVFPEPSFIHDEESLASLDKDCSKNATSYASTDFDDRSRDVETARPLILNHPRSILSQKCVRLSNGPDQLSIDENRISDGWQNAEVFSGDDGDDPFALKHGPFEKATISPVMTSGVLSESLFDSLPILATSIESNDEFRSNNPFTPRILACSPSRKSRVFARSKFSIFEDSDSSTSNSLNRDDDGYDENDYRLDQENVCEGIGLRINENTMFAPSNQVFEEHASETF